MLRLLLVVWLALLPVCAEAAELPEATRSLAEDSADGRIEQHSFLEAAWLGARTCREDALRRDTDKLRTRVRAIVDRMPSTANVSARLGHLHQALHADLLRGPFDPDASEVDTVLRTGRFNCVSSTLLLCLLADEAKIPLEALAADSHVFVRTSGSVHWYCETTCRDWTVRQLDACPEEVQARVRQARVLTRDQLIGKVFYNAGVALLEEEAFAKAVAAFEVACHLDPIDVAAFQNQLATYNNWALATAEREDLPGAIELLERGLRLDPAHGPLVTNDLHLHQRLVRGYCGRGEFATALAALDRAYARRPEAELFGRGRGLVCEWWAREKLSQGEIDEGLVALRELRRVDPAWQATSLRIVQLALRDLESRGEESAAQRLQAIVQETLNGLGDPAA